ncbi:MAG TPA: choice-of-anchor D domain-containing protein [Nocardioides sp.]|uniref:choice-of-anchor D domain-containing protein n=1 Tax=Nocardioides sp. TaxID=35761 RepID=UPI002E31F49E|nr:choice-of-anchor D domain-containing protein [Nocardioides sp.]HEX5087842.1 choice-of-anchor D domain-containing protein [Nocardioides sp.]
MSEALNPDANEGESEGVPEQLQERESDRDGRTDNRRWRYAVRDVEALPAAGTGLWQQIGPAPQHVANDQRFQGVGPVAGEVVDIAIDPRVGDTRTMYAAAGNGGLWKSSDAGQTWRPVTDQLPATAIGAVAIDPVDPDTIYIGTGNLFNGAAGMAKSAGLFKSVDGGQSWSRLNSPAGRPPQAITAAANVAGGVRVTVAAHGYASLDRVVAVGLPGIVGARGEGPVRRIDADNLRIGGLTMTGAFNAAAGPMLFDARQPPFLSDRGVIRMVCPAAGTLLVAAETGLYYSRDGGRNFGANHPTYDDGRPVRTGLISALELDQGWMRTIRVGNATPTAPIAVTLPNHGLVAGDKVTIGGVTDNAQANGTWVVDVVDADHVTLRGSDGNGTGAVSGFAIGPSHPVTQPVTGATNPAAPNPIVVTCVGHGWVTGDIVAVSGVTGNTNANGSWPIRVLSPDTFALVGSRGNAAYAGGGIVDGPRHAAPQAITAAVNVAGGVELTVAAHNLLAGDRVSVLGLPGIAAPGNSASVRVRDPNTIRLAGLTMNAAYGGAGATLAGPADAFNTAYFAGAGRLLGTTTLNPDRGLFRLTVTSTGELVLSPNLMRNTGGPPSTHGRVAFTQSLLPRAGTLYISVQDIEGVNQGIFVGMFRSRDFGGSWTLCPAFTPRVNVDGGGFTNYMLLVAVDPQDSTRVYGAQQQLWRSVDGGTTWPTVNPVTAGGVDQMVGFGRSPSTTLLHWDHHELVFPPPTWWSWNLAPAVAPVAPTPAYHGTDGGVAISGTTAAGAMTFTALNQGVATNLMTSLDIGRGAGNNAVSFTGLQDTGTAGHRRGDASGVWVAGVDADGGPVAVDSFDPDIVFGTRNGQLMRTTNGGATWSFANSGLAERRTQIENVENTNPVRVTVAGHSFRTGDVVTISGVRGGNNLANGAATVTVVDKRRFTLNGKNGTTVPAFGPFPRVTGDRFLTQVDIVAATLSAPIEIETATPHGCATGQRVRIETVEGNVAANNTDARSAWQVTVISPTRLSLDGSDGSASGQYVSRTGRLRGPGVNGSLPVFTTTNANPIVVTAQGHGFLTGDQVTVSDVTGNAAANGAGRQITVLDANSFILDGVAGNGAPGAAPRVVGLAIGRGLPGSGYLVRIAMVPVAGGPSTKIFVSMDRTLYRSTNGGISFVAMAVFADFITALHAPVDGRLWLATGALFGNNRNYRVRLSTNDGASFLGAGAPANFASDVGARSFISQILEDPQVPNGQRVAVVCSGYSRTATSRRTRHVFETTNQGRTTGGAVPWRELGGVFDAAAGNLPDVPVHGAVWDTTVNPSRLLLATDLGVLRLDPAGPSWERIGPNLPRAGVQAIAADMSVNPPVVRVGTYGRSAWELRVPTGPALHVEADLGFGDLQVGETVRRPLVLHSVGAADVHVTGIEGAVGDVTVESVPPGAVLPLTMAPGERRTFDVVFSPTAVGDRGAFLTVRSDDTENPTVPVKVTGFGVAAGAPRLGARAFVEFGVVRTGAPSDLALELRNLGDAPLRITGLAPDPRGNARFSLPAPPALPFTIPPSGSTSVTVRFDPNANGEVRSGLTVTGDGGQGQVVTLVGRGTTTAAGMVAVLFEQLGISDQAEAVG